MPEFSISAALRRMRTTLGDPDPVPELPGYRADGPVVLVGGLFTTRLTLDPMRAWLERLGYAVSIHTVGAGMGCGADSVARLAETVRAVADTAGEPVRLLGYSRGGQFGRVLAQDPAAPIRSLVTLGTPFDPYGIRRPLLVQAAAIALAGTLGTPGLATLSCVFGSCCSEFRDRLRAPVPVPFSAIYSRRDGVVRWQACLDPTVRTVEVPGSHLGLLADPVPLLAVAAELRRGDLPAHTGATAATWA